MGLSKLPEAYAEKLAFRQSRQLFAKDAKETNYHEKALQHGRQVVVLSKALKQTKIQNAEHIKLS